jgi:antitoxin (DNA-binding transcriptional repressor) of toxin-antitoxin stability system
MKTVTIRDLNRRTASILDSVQRGETFELRRKGKVVGYLSSEPPQPENKPDWKSHFEWLRKQPKRGGAALMKEFARDRKRLREREKAFDNLR